jgi:hypothetical protein
VQEIVNVVVFRCKSLDVFGGEVIKATKMNFFRSRVQSFGIGIIIGMGKYGCRVLLAGLCREI